MKTSWKKLLTTAGEAVGPDFLALRPGVAEGRVLPGDAQQQSMLLAILGLMFLVFPLCTYQSYRPTTASAASRRRCAPKIGRASCRERV